MDQLRRSQQHQRDLRSVYDSYQERMLEAEDRAHEDTENTGRDLYIAEFARENATQAALTDIPFAREENKVKKFLKSAKQSAFTPAKDKIAQARKPKMRTVQQYLCDLCDCVIEKNKTNMPNGFVIHGNIYQADPDKRGGLIGNNIPEVQEGEKIEPEKIKETVLCTACFFKSLNLVPEVPDIRGLDRWNEPSGDVMRVGLGEHDTGVRLRRDLNQGSIWRPSRPQRAEALTSEQASMVQDETTPF